VTLEEMLDEKERQQAKHIETLGARPPWWRPFARRRFDRCVLFIQRMHHSDLKSMLSAPSGQRDIIANLIGWTPTVLAFLLLACTSTTFDLDGPHDWTCDLVWTCGSTGTADEEHFEQLTADEMWTIASDWATACDAIAKYAVERGTCPFVFCWAPCTTTDGGGQ